MGLRRAQPPRGSEQHLPRQVVEIPPSSPAPILRPVALRAVVRQQDEAYAAPPTLNWIDAALLYGERLIGLVLVVFVAFRIVDGPVRDWTHVRRASAHASAEVQRSAAVGPQGQAAAAVAVEPKAQSGKTTPGQQQARHPELGRSLPSSAPRRRRAVAVDYLTPARDFVPAALPMQRPVEPVTKPIPADVPAPVTSARRASLLPIAPIIVPGQARDPRPTHLRAPGIGLDAAVVEVFLEHGAWQVADYAAGYHHGTGLPGEGNTVMAGHKGVRGAVFARVEALKAGDEIFVDTVDRRFRYRVRETRSVWPSDVDVMYPTPTPTLTLLTCTNWDIQRFVVIADLVDSARLSTSAGG